MKYSILHPRLKVKILSPFTQESLSIISITILFVNNKVLIIKLKFSYLVLDQFP